jgi:hypothetical protein
MARSGGTKMTQLEVERMDDIIRGFPTRPQLRTRSEVMVSPIPVPAHDGVCGCGFVSCPGDLDTKSCIGPLTAELNSPIGG